MEYPATKATPNLAMHAIKNFLATFEYNEPAGAIRSVKAIGQDGTPIFTLSIDVPA